MAKECVITAAGASSRMGSWKPLLPFGRLTVIETTVAAAREAGLRVILVVGFRGDELIDLFAGTPSVSCVRNPDWESGLFGSIIRGIEAVSGTELFLMNGDKPLVRADAYRALEAEAERRRTCGLPQVPLFSAFGGKAGHPVLVRRDIALAAVGDGSTYERASTRKRMRDHLLRFDPILVECGDESVLLDIDTPEDYERLRSMAAQRGL